jgi:hypothetical protein
MFYLLQSAKIFYGLKKNIGVNATKIIFIAGFKKPLSNA